MGAESSASSSTGAEGSANVPASGESEVTSEARSTEQPSQKQAQQSQAQDEDPEVDFFGEKVKKSEYKRLRELEAKRREYDRAASMRMEQAAKREKEYASKEQKIQAALAAFAKSPEALFNEAGLDPLEWAEQRISGHLKQAQLTPEQKELQRAREELARIKADKDKLEADTKKQKHEAEVNRWLQHFDKAIGTALEQGGLPRTASMAQRVRDALETLVDTGHQVDDMSAGLARDIAYDNAVKDTQALLGDLVAHPQQLIEMLGGLDGEIVKTIQRQAIARHESTQLQRPKPRVASVPKQATNEPPTFEEVRKKLGIA